MVERVRKFLRVNLRSTLILPEGVGRSDDVLPERIQKEKLLDAGPAEGQTVAEMGKMLDEYYRLRGWTQEGIPSPEKLKALGLEAAAHHTKLGNQDYRFAGGMQTPLKDGITVYFIPPVVGG